MAGSRTRSNVELTSHTSGKKFVLPVEIILTNSTLEQWWASSNDDLMGDVLRIVEFNSQILSKDNILTTEGGSLSAKRKKTEFDPTLRGSFLEATWEIRDPRPKATIMTFSQGNRSGFSLVPMLPVTLLLWPIPLVLLEDTDDELSGGVDKITSYFGSSSSSSSSRRPKKSSAKKIEQVTPAKDEK
mmetsp:Transcript_72203/g.141582  ORF Transcript_72203/g.141582 Transcript_72203/m.141582 type:complete len:186 (+) Transcript_72203:106-663(+)